MRQLRRSAVIFTLLGLGLHGGGCGGGDEPGTNDNANQNNANQNQNTNQNQNNANQNNNSNQPPLVPYTGPLDALDGFYRLDAVTLEGGSEDPIITTTPSWFAFGGGLGQGVVRGNATLESSGASDGGLQLRFLVTIDDSLYGNLAFHWEVATWSLTWEATEWRALLEEGERVAVYRVGREGETVTLELDGEDERNVGDAPALRVVMTRSAPPTSAIAGRWVYESAKYARGSNGYFHRQASCSPGDPSDYIQGAFGRLDATMIIEESGWMHREALFSTWSSPDCSGTATAERLLSHDFYYALESGGDGIDYWYDGVGSDFFHIHQAATYTLDGTRLRITSDEREMSCDPETVILIVDATLIPAP